MLGVKRTHAAPPPEDAPVQAPEAPQLPGPAEATEVETTAPRVDRSPPKPDTAPKEPASSPPVNRSLFAGQGGSGMDDLFGMGGGQGRLRIRKPKEEPKTDGEESKKKED